MPTQPAKPKAPFLKDPKPARPPLYHALIRQIAARRSLDQLLAFCAKHYPEAQGPEVKALTVFWTKRLNTRGAILWVPKAELFQVPEKPYFPKGLDLKADAKPRKVRSDKGTKKSADGVKDLAENDPAKQRREDGPLARKAEKVLANIKAGKEKTTPHAEVMRRASKAPKTQPIARTQSNTKAGPISLAKAAKAKAKAAQDFADVPDVG